jgi:hypothetical protein
MMLASALGFGVAGGFLWMLAGLANAAAFSPRIAARTRWCAVFGGMFLLTAGAHLMGGW